MKVMDVAMDTAEESVPKQKKLKQARLPFQMLTSPLSSNTSTKKRKLSSPSPTNCKSPKVLKVENKKENSSKPSEIPEIDITSDKEDAVESGIEVSGSPDTMSSSKDKKIEPKHSMKPGALTRLFQKQAAAAAPPKPPPMEDDQIPLVILNRCNNESEEKSSEPVAASSSPGKSPKTDDSSNDALAEVLPTSEDDDDDENSKEKSQNSESDTPSSSSEDDKKSHDEDCSKNSSDNLLKTPTQSKNSGDIPLKKRRLTPKQVEKRLESAKKKEERQRAKAERELQRNEERMKRRKEQEEKKIARKAKEEAEKELRKREKEQKELKKQLDIEQKQREKERRERAKEEDKRKREEAKEEEKRKKEEEKLEAERKKQKAASTFVRFFVAKKLENSKTGDEDREKVDKVSNFMPFQVRKDMKIAPRCRRSLRDEEKSAVDECLGDHGGKGELYIKEIKKESWKMRKSGKTWPADDVAKDDVVIIEEDDGDSSIVNEPERTIEKYRAKLLLFKENRRPPYWGTWRKKSLVINPRRPFTKDTKWFDYEVDSDEEWEEEEPGESLRGSDDEKDEENPDDNEYDVDNEFMVPHGYLSDEEAQADEEDEEEMPLELQKDKLKILEEEFEAEMKTKTSKIKPKVVGCIWLGILNSYPENTPAHIINFLMARQGWPKEAPIALTPPAESEALETENLSKKGIPEEAVPDLIRLIHGNLHGRPFLVKEFFTYWTKNHPGHDNSFTKVSVSRKIKDLSKRIPCPEEGPMHLKACWYVTEETRRRYSLEDLRLPNQWTYSLTPKRKTLTEAPVLSEKNEKDVKEKPKDSEQKKTAPLITMFTKKITQEEMQKQLQVRPSTPKPASPLNRPPKRATLISVPRGDQAPSILTAFSKISNGKPQVSSGRADEPITISDDENSRNRSVDDTTIHDNETEIIFDITENKTDD
ncbi:chromatin assembly factor 1 subunit A [Diachasma alloeum]|uniref:chromatin assembly factor 1 subunit A n=1 Tax=Diachasma alloeum TaxID=454923 RepID=UPI00073833FB|nr:chromatin assembly factor 1 subunit A [Diachasma alloeum]